MKKLISLSVILSFFLSSCDKIDTPLQKAPGVKGCIDTLTQIVKSNAGKTNYRKVLLEDYTGHKCPNCPRAAEIAENLSATYGSSLVVIANHVTQIFAAPQDEIHYKEDFRNPTTTKWSETFSMASLPTGMVNRKPAAPQGRSVWATLVPLALNNPQTAKIDLTTYYDKTTKYLTVKAKTTFLTAWPNNTKLQIVLTQDSIISDQTDNNPPAGVPVDPEEPIRRLNYRHDHIVFGSMNGDWGETAKNSPISANDTVSKTYECFLVEKCFFQKEGYPSVCLDDKNISVVAFIYDETTYEILQVEKVKIR